jgi:zinc/manganese transport system substrate-binding protein
LKHSIMNTMLRQLLCAFAVLVALPRLAHAELKIVATTADLASIAAEIGKGHASVTALALPTQDPHFVDPRPHLALDLARADLLLAVGLDLEVGWLPTLQLGARNPKIQRGSTGYLECATLVDLMDVPRERVDRSQGDIHPGGNPHVMFDPRRAAKIAAGIAARMGELDPSHQQDYQNALRGFLARLDSARKRWETSLAALRGQKIVSYHRSLSYFADWLGISIVAQIEPKPGIPPSPHELTGVLTLIKTQHARLIVQEQWYPSNVSQTLAEHAGVKLVRIPGGPDYNHGKSYCDFMDTLVAVVKAAL